MADYLKLPLVERKAAPAGVPVPALAVVGVDGGRVQIFDRPSTRAATEDAASTPPETEEPVQDEQHRGQHWREDKIGLLMTMQSAPSLTDPCVTIPESLVDPTRILKLARELKTKRSSSVDDGVKEEPAEADRSVTLEVALEDRPDHEPRWEPPEVREKTLVATRQPWSAFGPMVATAAWELGFFAAERRAFLGDGSSNNWTLWRRHFSSFVPILDFIHGLSYVFAAAMAGRKFSDGWPIYVVWIQWVWSGSVEKVIAALAVRQEELGTPTTDDAETSPRRVVATALGYLQENKDRMRYAEYRTQGLPITSSYVESAVKQFNYRVKGTEKFWSEEGAEGMLQLRGDDLSDGEVMEDYWQRKEAGATGQRRRRQVA